MKTTNRSYQTKTTTPPRIQRDLTADQEAQDAQAGRGEAVGSGGRAAVALWGGQTGLTNQLMNKSKETTEGRLQEDNG